MSENPPIHENSLDDFRALHQEVLLFWDLGLPLATTLWSSTDEPKCLLEKTPTGGLGME